MINWDSIDTVLLDMDGTLLDLHFDNYFWAGTTCPAVCGETRHPGSRCHLCPARRFDGRQGTLDWYSLDYWSAQLDMDVPSLKQELRHMIRLRPHALEFLQRLHAGPREVVLVTNAHRKTLDIKMAQVDITPWFDRMVVSPRSRRSQGGSGLLARPAGTASIQSCPHPAD